MAVDRVQEAIGRDGGTGGRGGVGEWWRGDLIVVILHLLVLVLLLGSLCVYTGVYVGSVLVAVHVVIELLLTFVFIGD